MARLLLISTIIGASSIISLTFNPNFFSLLNISESYPGELSTYLPLLRIIITSCVVVLYVESHTVTATLVTFQAILSLAFANLKLVEQMILNIASSNEMMRNAVELETFKQLTQQLNESPLMKNSTEMLPFLFAIMLIYYSEQDNAPVSWEPSFDNFEMPKMPNREEMKQNLENIRQNIETQVEKAEEKVTEAFEQAEQYMEEHYPDINHSLVPEALSDDLIVVDGSENDRTSGETRNGKAPGRNNNSGPEKSRKSEVLRQAREAAAKQMEERTRLRIAQLQKRK